MKSILDSTLNHQEIEKKLPHAGKMCLLHEVISADINSLKALAISHQDTDNPLRIKGKIAIVNGIEYAAQAMAVHGTLLSEQSDSPRSGYIATVRNIELKVPFFPENNSPLIIEVKQLMSDNNGFTYQFFISCEQEALISGKITVFLTL